MKLLDVVNKSDPNVIFIGLIRCAGAVFPPAGSSLATFTVGNSKTVLTTLLSQFLTSKMTLHGSIEVTNSGLVLRRIGLTFTIMMHDIIMDYSVLRSLLYSEAIGLLRCGDNGKFFGFDVELGFKIQISGIGSSLSYSINGSFSETFSLESCSFPSGVGKIGLSSSNSSLEIFNSTHVLNNRQGSGGISTDSFKEFRSFLPVDTSEVVTGWMALSLASESEFLVLLVMSNHICFSRGHLVGDDVGHLREEMSGSAAHSTIGLAESVAEQGGRGFVGVRIGQVAVFKSSTAIGILNSEGIGSSTGRASSVEDNFQDLGT